MCELGVGHSCGFNWNKTWCISTCIRRPLLCRGKGCESGGQVSCMLHFCLLSRSAVLLYSCLLSFVSHLLASVPRPRDPTIGVSPWRKGDPGPHRKFHKSLYSSKRNFDLDIHAERYQMVADSCHDSIASLMSDDWDGIFLLWRSERF